MTLAGGQPVSARGGGRKECFHDKNRYYTLQEDPAPDAPSPDVNDDGRVDGADMGLLLALWGTDDPDMDLDGSGDVGGGDLGILLAAWSE